ncbi:hypothetical protein B0H11DRAFT_1909706 [Mycena galericulata]|nr:hypothetical protein B0H11DRAFT_1909706 [Mycena galericulata]
MSELNATVEKCAPASLLFPPQTIGALPPSNCPDSGLTFEVESERVIHCDALHDVSFQLETNYAVEGTRRDLRAMQPETASPCPTLRPTLCPAVYSIPHPRKPNARLTHAGVPRRRGWCALCTLPSERRVRRVRCASQRLAYYPLFLSAQTMDPLATDSDQPQSTGTGLSLDSATVDAVKFIEKFMADAAISTTFPSDIQGLLEDIKGVKHHQSEFKNIAHEIGHLGIVAIGQLGADKFLSLLTDIHDLSCKCQQQSNRTVAMIWVPIKIQGYRKKLRHSLQKLSVALQMETNHVVDQTQRDLSANQPENPSSPAHTQPAEPRIERTGNVYTTNVNGNQNFNGPTFNFATPGIYGVNFGLPIGPPLLTSPLGSNSPASVDNGESN